MNCHVCDDEYIRTDRTDVRECRSCGHQYKVVDIDLLEYHYRQYRADPKNRRTAGEFGKDGKPTVRFHRARQGIVKGRFKAIRKHLDRTDRCLDVGAGAGTWATFVWPHIGSIECLEIDPILAAECKRLKHKTHQSDFLSAELEPYDTVFSWHVLEHVEDIRAFVAKVHRLVQRLCVLEIPFNRPIPKRFDGHVQFFSRDSFIKLFSEFEILELKDGVQKPALLAILKNRSHE